MCLAVFSRTEIVIATLIARFVAEILAIGVGESSHESCELDSGRHPEATKAAGKKDEILKRKRWKRRYGENLRSDCGGSASGAS